MSINRLTRKFVIQATLILIHYLSVLWTAFSSYDLIDFNINTENSEPLKYVQENKGLSRTNKLGIVQQSAQLSKIDEL